MYCTLTKTNSHCERKSKQKRKKEDNENLLEKNEIK